MNQSPVVPGVDTFASKSAVGLAATTSSCVLPSARAPATLSRSAMIMSRCAVTAVLSTIGPCPGMIFVFGLCQIDHRLQSVDHAVQRSAVDASIFGY